MANGRRGHGEQEEDEAPTSEASRKNLSACKLTMEDLLLVYFEAPQTLKQWVLSSIV